MVLFAFVGFTNRYLWSKLSSVGGSNGGLLLDLRRSPFGSHIPVIAN